MRILAIDTATQRCSVALSDAGDIAERSADTPRGHADMVLPMIQSLLAERDVALSQLDGIAYGRGPGAFTGVRIAVGVAQGLAFGAQKLTVGVSNLAAVAQQFAYAMANPRERVLVCMDARMGEVYWGVFDCDRVSGRVLAVTAENVASPEQVLAQVQAVTPLTLLAGTGFAAYPQLSAAFPEAGIFAHALPHARDIARLALREFEEGRGQSAVQAQPVYLRNQVAVVKRK